MPLAEVEGEASTPLGDLDPLGDVGHEAVVAVEADQAGVTVHEGQLHVLQSADQHPELAPVDRLGIGGQDARALGEPLSERWELAGCHELSQRGRLPSRRADGDGAQRQAEREREPDRNPAGLHLSLIHI